MLLRRNDVVFRDLLERETTIPRWRELVAMFRRLEARGSVRGGRFVNGFGGEQFAVPEAVASLRDSRLQGNAEEAVTVAATDPLNLAGMVVPGERPAAVPGKTVTFLGGAVGWRSPAWPQLRFDNSLESFVTRLANLSSTNLYAKGGR